MAKKPDKPPAVILLHGLARGASSMHKLEAALNAGGFKDTKSYDYPSTTLPIDKLARRLASRLRQDWKDRPLHAVTHSLGGILLRHIRDDRIRWRRIVMLAPPNQGSAVAAAMMDGAFSWAFTTVMGPAGKALGAVTEASAHRAWPFPPAPFAVIAGTRKRDVMNPTSVLISHRVFDGKTEHDGTVAVEETKLDGVAAFTTVDASHTAIMDTPEVHRLVLRFLQRGTFDDPR
jgi:hypothetical protein